MEKDRLYMYVSSWDEHGGKPGLALYSLSQENGTIEHIKTLDEESSVNYSYIDQKQNRMYLCNEIPETPGCAYSTGRVFVCDLDPVSGDVVRRRDLLTGCPNPSYVSKDKTGRFFMIAHHSTYQKILRHRRDDKGVLTGEVRSVEADLQLYEMGDDGYPARLTDNIDHVSYTSADGDAHPHCCVVSPSGKLIAVADKGLGRLYLYTIDEETKRFRLLSQADTDGKNAHPRYVVFHPQRKFLFVNHEASVDGRMYVTAFRYDEDGTLERICVTDAAEGTLQPDPDIRLEQQGFVISPDGRHLYTQLNSVSRIAVLEIDQENGSLTLIQNIATDGEWPRGLAITPNGRFLIASSLRTGELTVYEREAGGLLKKKADGPVQKGASYISFYLPEAKDVPA